MLKKEVTNGKSENNVRGRPVDPEISQKIIAATWKLLSQNGYDALSFEAISKEIGSNRATIYRRYATKAKLVHSVLRDTLYSLKPNNNPDQNPRDAIFELVKIGIRYLSDGRGSAVLNIASIAHKSPELAEVFDLHLTAVTPYYIKQFRCLAPDATDDTLNFALNCLIGGFFFHSAVKRTSLKDKQIYALIDQAILIAQND